MYKEYQQIKPAIIFHKGPVPRTKPFKNVIFMSDKNSKGRFFSDTNLGIERVYGLEPNIRHELRHISDYVPVGNKKKWLELPSSLKESSAHSAEFVSVRKPTPQKIVDENKRRFMENVF